MPLHPFITDMLERAAASPDNQRVRGEPADRRALLAMKRPGLGQGPDIASVTEMTITVEGGEIGARLYQPGPDPLGLIVYLHGGGWVVGCMDDFDTLARTLAVRTNCLVLLPEYRLAPEYPFPTGLEDVKKSIVFAQAEICSARSDLPLIVAGDSAGGNLATVALSELAEQIDVAGQVLVYPVTDHAMDTPSYRQYATGLTLTTDDMTWFFEHYSLPSDRRSARISPLRSLDLSRQPPTFLATAEYDVLHSEGEAYANRLADAGVPVTYRCYKGLAHGFIRLHNLVDVADAALDDIAEFVIHRCRAGVGSITA